ncbi:MAG: hypothetical protein HYY64_12870 [Candidatus Rokubacteria bacterium]|nr:hypothetical protein [Candidatus Rokubacteria bacterium]
MTLGRSLDSARRERWGVIRRPGWTDLGEPNRVRLVEQGASRQLDPLVA